MEKTHKNAEAQSVYERMIEIFFYGKRIEDLNKIVSKTFIGYGTAAHEFFLSINDLIKMAETQSEQLKNHPVEITRNPILCKSLQDGSSYLIVEEFQMHDRKNDYRYKARLSAILEKIEEKWLITHFHGSTPDSNVSEEESLPMEGLRRKNLALEEKIKERTRELETKNRQLEIEGALERIRAQAVAMKTSSDLLDIVVTMRNEFIKLGHEAQYFWHMMWLPETYEKAMTSGDGSKIGFVMQLPRHIHGNIPKLAKWEKSKKPTVVFTMTVDEAIDYVDKMVALGDFKNIDPQAPSHDDIKHIGGLTFIMSRTTHGEIGYSLPGIVKSPPKEDIDILVKFASAFDLAHQRFLDLQKAETQTRETQIELALEKVRSRSMAMHKSDELKEVIQVVYDQFVQLQVPIDHAGFILDYKENEDMHIWLADHNAVFPKIVLPYFDCAHWNNFIEAKKTGGNFFTNQLGFEEKNKFYNDLFQFIPDLPEETKATYFGFKGLAISTVLLDTVGLYIENYSGNPFSDEENAILMRFGKVFQQAYTRFLDLQKAEAQAREAKIESALERVRSRSLAMHHSSELSAVVDTLMREFTNLEFTLTFCIINLINEQEMSNTVWAANPETGKDPESYYMRFEDYPFHHAMWDGWKAQKKRFVYTLEGEEKKIYDEYLYSETEFRRFPKHVQDANKALERYVAGFTFFKYSGLQTVSVNPISEDELEILERFGRVFEQAYTRFLDLQKAEAQTREAQIETALEKVRSRTMAMQKGDELQEVAVLLYKELIALGVTNFVTCGYVEVHEKTNKQHTWVTAPGGDTLGLFYLPLTGDATFDERYAAWKKQQTVFHQTVAGDVRSNHLEFAITTFNSKEAEEMVRSQFPDPTVFYCFNFSHGYLHLVTGSLLKKEEELLLARFTKIFEQTYTRFLDLQKAEAQAKEAQIEAALERVRSQSMGMQSSTDFSAVTTEMFNQLRRFDGDLFATGIVFCDKHEGHVEQWHSIPDAGMLTPFIVPIDLDYIHQYRYDEWKKGTELFSVEIPEHFIKQHFDAIFNLPSAQKVFKRFGVKQHTNARSTSLGN